MVGSKWALAIVCLSIMTLFVGACSEQQTTTPQPTAIYTLPELKYGLLSSFDDVFWVDPDFYPIGREGKEQENALKQFITINTDALEFSAILEYLNLPNKTAYTDEEKLFIYREHKKLTYAVRITSSENIYNFTLLIGEGQGERIEGTIAASGEIEVLKRTPSINTYPICLTKGTLIDTPSGLVSVEQVHIGMYVWTIDELGNRISSIVIKTSMTKLQLPFQVVRIRLSDGRTVTASPGHPAAEGKTLGVYHLGDILDGALVMEIENVIYNSDTTYDILPAGSSHVYWANGVLLMSTLEIHKD